MCAVTKKEKKKTQLSSTKPYITSAVQNFEVFMMNSKTNRCMDEEPMLSQLLVKLISHHTHLIDLDILAWRKQLDMFNF